MGDGMAADLVTVRRNGVQIGLGQPAWRTNPAGRNKKRPVQTVRVQHLFGGELIVIPVIEGQADDGFRERVRRDVDANNGVANQQQD